MQKLLLLLLVFGLTLGVAILNGFVNFYRCNLGNLFLLYYIGGLSGTIMVLLVSRFICCLNSPFIKSKLIWLGKNTIVPMAVHQFLIKVGDHILSIFSMSLPFTRLILYALELCVVILMSILIGFLIDRYFPNLIRLRKKSI